MSQTLVSAFQKGLALRDLLPKLARLSEAGKPLKFEVESRSVPYLDHLLSGWTDGPPTSSVAFVLSAREPNHDHWRRFTISKVAPWTFRLECFPTPFGKADAPLAPGMPPSQTR